MIGQWAENLAAATGLRPWALIVFSIVLAALLLDFFQRKLMKRLENLVQQSTTLWDDAIFAAAARPLSFVIWVLGITLAAQWVPAREGGLLSAAMIIKLRQLGLLYAIAWFLYTFVRKIERNTIKRATLEGRTVDKTTVNALGRVVRITIVITALLIGLDTLGFDIAGLMAVGGIGGLAIGLAAKDILANFFGGVTVFIDRPFSIGDWIILKDKDIEGVVEEIGWRQTTIRKFDKRPVYVPNAAFTTASVENPSRMTNRRIYETIGMRYKDISQVEPVTNEVREMLVQHPEIDEKQTLMVHFDAFGESSVDFFIYCMTHTVNWQRYHEVKQDVLLQISRIVQEHGAAIAFPTRTLELESIPEFAGQTS
ncbi:MAG: mechanosensitive ion channel family protein [Xanthomonadales bacterium]|nr:mechanosensitive ion channel family protein [Gammaproteobacteria bacterium]MBT8053758.1 mechanosensitive ion channel family protein [Gammaproteobacteria bacterium]NNK51595.1 mechanosensitive ion channel family protein [Xanthomonadales bacterium]